VTLGVRLKAFRLAAGLSRNALALRAAISGTKFSDYERDRVEPRLLTLGRLARALGVSLQALEGDRRAAP
jgi:transcriptional regulator with XRE-family HTH domain